MEQHILSILKESNTIIIPNLGALTITNQTTGEIMFMPYLKYDDGKLSTYIAEQEGISSDDAKSKITNFTENILNKLATNGIVNVAGIGTFTKGDDDIEFTHNAEQEASKIESVSTHETTTQETIIEEKAIETIEESSVTEQVTSKVEETVETETEIKSDIQNDKTEEPSSIDTDAPQQEIIKEEEAPEVSKEDKKATIKAEKEAKAKAEKEAKEKAKTEKEAKIKAEKEAKAKAKAEKKKGNTAVEGEEGQPKKKKKLLPLLIILVLVLSGGTYIALNFEHLKDKIPFLGHKDHTTEEGKGNEKEETEATTEEMHKKAEGKHENSNSNTHSAATSGTFYIILGTFTEKVNAEGLAERINMDGTSSNASVIERNGSYSVIFNQYSSKDAALSELESVRTNFPKAWIFTAN